MISDKLFGDGLNDIFIDKLCGKKCLSGHFSPSVHTLNLHSIHTVHTLNVQLTYTNLAPSQGKRQHSEYTCMRTNDSGTRDCTYCVYEPYIHYTVHMQYTTYSYTIHPLMLHLCVYICVLPEPNTQYLSSLP